MITWATNCSLALVTNKRSDPQGSPVRPQLVLPHKVRVQILNKQRSRSNVVEGVHTLTVGQVGTGWHRWAGQAQQTRPGAHLLSRSDSTDFVYKLLPRLNASWSAFWWRKSGHWSWGAHSSPTSQARSAATREQRKIVKAWSGKQPPAILSSTVEVLREDGEPPANITCLPVLLDTSFIPFVQQAPINISSCVL